MAMGWWTSGGDSGASTDGKRRGAGEVKITAAPSFGLIEQKVNGQWAVDSFFDITYRIDFETAPARPIQNCTLERLQVAGISELAAIPQNTVFNGSTTPIPLCDVEGVIRTTGRTDEHWTVNRPPNPNLPYQDCMDATAQVVFVDSSGTRRPSRSRVRSSSAGDPEPGPPQTIKTEIVSLSLSGKSAALGTSVSSRISTLSPGLAEAVADGKYVERWNCTCASA